jgi:hypothetical protein
MEDETMSDEQKPRLYMVTVEFEVPVLATSREAAEEHASHDYDIWSDMRGDAGHVHAREITKASQLAADMRDALPWLAADVEDSEERTCAEWVPAAEVTP